MNPNCNICKAIQERKVKIVYEDDKCAAYLEQNPASIGHTIIAPKEHCAILEQTPDYIMGRMLVISNKISVALFESLNIQGTNILIQNGIEAGQKHPHLAIHIIPRIEGDKIGLQWKTLAPSPEDLATAELQLKDHVKNIGEFEKEKAPPVILDSKKERISSSLPDSEEENYLVKQLRRIP